jgi:pimeloyl-ACP methyl ester carboxylesterase
MRTVAIAIPVAVVLAFTMLFAIQRSLVFPTHAIRVPDEPRTKPEAAEQWWLETPDGEVEGWYVAGDGRSADHPGPAVIFAHGNGEVIDYWPELMNWYADRGISVLLAEYRGYGRSAGDPSSEAITEDFVAFRERLARRPAVDPDQLIYHGRSLGGGAVCNLARRHPPAGLILQSTFTSLADLAWHHYYAPDFMLRDEFDNLAYARQSDVPMLITHGTRDEIIPVQQARRLHDAAATSTYVEIDGAGHNDGGMPREEIEEFVRRLGVKKDVD